MKSRDGNIIAAGHCPVGVRYDGRIRGTGSPTRQASIGDGVTTLWRDIGV